MVSKFNLVTYTHTSSAKLCRSWSTKVTLTLNTGNQRYWSTERSVIFIETIWANIARVLSVVAKPSHIQFQEESFVVFCSVTYLKKDWFRFPSNSADCHWTWGLGFKISFPVSSQDILYSASIVRHRAAIIDGATTLLCMPAKNKPIRVIQLIVKNGWFHKDVKKDTFCVSGSISQFQAPVAVQTDTTIRSILQRPVAGCKQWIYSVSLLSKALRSSACSSEFMSGGSSGHRRGQVRIAALRPRPAGSTNSHL